MVLPTRGTAVLAAQLGAIARDGIRWPPAAALCASHVRRFRAVCRSSGAPRTLLVLAAG